MGSLVAAIGCVFVLAGGVVAFHGWPELDSAGSGPTLVVADVPRAPLQVAAVRSKKASSGPASHVVAGARAAHAPRRVIASVPRRAVNHGSSVSATPPATTPAPPAKKDPSASPLEPVANGTEQTTNGLGQTVTNVTGGLGDTVGGPLGETVTNLGETLGKTVSGTGTLLANILRAIKPAQ